MKKSFIVLLTLFLTASAAFAAGKITTVQRPTGLPSFVGYVPDRLIVVMKPDVGKLNMQMAANAVAHIGDRGFDKISDRFAVSSIRKQFMGSKPGSLSKSAELARYYKIKFESGTLEEAMAAYRNHPMVERVEPIGIHAMYATPNDFYYSYQWHLNQASDHDIDAPEAWDIEAGSDATVVAILDSGTRYYHPDLGGVNASPSNPGASRGNMWINNAELNGAAGVDDDGNGYVDDWIGYDFIDGVSNCWPGEDCNTKDNDPRDFNGHGTHTSGIFGMITNDGYGMCGVAGGWGNGSQAEYGNGVKIMALRMGYSYNWFGQEYGVVMMDAAAEAFYYAADNGAKIASCSWGSSNSGGIGAAATYFLNSGGIIVVAAGNDGAETAPDYLNGRGDCISVSATDENDNGASFTTYGTWVDICAPGNNIYSTYHDHTDPNTNYWAAMGGTSMATPMAAGVAALIWSQNPGWSASQVENQLYSSADNIDAYLSAQYIGKMGAGRINAFNAVNTGTPPPVANFSGSPTSGCSPLTADFTDLSTGSITSWSWTFGDGGTSTAQNPSYTYNSPGTYTVSLTVTGPGGSDTNTKTNYITVDPAPVADFVGNPTSGTEPLTVNFTDQSINSPTNWSWDFGDGGTSTQQNPSYTYTAAGTYTVTLTATNACGSNQAVKTNYITVNPCVTPTAGFVGNPTSGDAPLTVNFTDQSSGASSWSWDFGDGGTSTQQNPSYTYNAAGTYTVTQTVTNACGSDQLIRTNYITVNQPPCNPPVADFVGNPTSGNAPLTVNFTDQSTNTPTSWSWDFGDGGASTQQNPAYTYNTAGTYTVTLTATNSCGSDQMVKTNYITVNTGPVTGEGYVLSRSADFSTDDRIFNRNETLYIKMWTDQVDYNDLSRSRYELRDPSGNRDRQPLTNHFDNTYTASYVLANLPSSATDWTWKGEVKDNAGNRYKPTDNIIVNSGPPPPPVADFVGNPTSGFAPLAVSFTDLSTNNPTSWSWDFGDGGTSTQQNPAYTYNNPGTYTVSLTATNAGGYDTNVKTNYITVNTCTAPVAGFVGSPTTGDAPLTVNFTDQSTNATSWNWDFGDGGTSTAQNPSYTYNTAGTYTVTQTVTNSCGSDQLVRTNYITVNQPPCNPPMADFVGNPTSGNAPLTVNFTDQTTNTPTSWSWNFGDGGTSTQQNPSYAYNTAGVYTVTLTASNACGSDQVVKVDYITVNSGPVTGEGYILSRNADFSTDDRVFDRSETLYMKVWTDQVDYNDLKKSEWELKDPNKNKVRQNLTNHFDNTYTASYVLANLPSSATDWTWKGKVEDNSRNKYQPTDNITVTGGAARTYSFSTPDSYELTQNYPNPFNPSTEISFVLPESKYVTLEVYNLLGQRVAVLADGIFGAGEHTVTWNALDYSSGLYFYRLVADDYMLTRKMLLLK